MVFCKKIQTILILLFLNLTINGQVVYETKFDCEANWHVFSVKDPADADFIIRYVDSPSKLLFYKYTTIKYWYLTKNYAEATLVIKREKIYNKNCAKIYERKIN